MIVILTAIETTTGIGAVNMDAILNPIGDVVVVLNETGEIKATEIEEGVDNKQSDRDRKLANERRHSFWPTTGNIWLPFGHAKGSIERNRGRGNSR